MEGSGSAAPQPLPAPSSPEYRYNPARWAQRQDAISLLWVQQEPAWVGTQPHELLGQVSTRELGSQGVAWHQLRQHHLGVCKQCNLLGLEETY